LPAPAGAKLNWLAYSEDDAWLIAARKDGTAFAFDIATGLTLHSSELHQDFELYSAAISHRDRTVLLSGEGGVAVWRLPNAGLEGVEAARLIANPTRSEPASIYWSAAALQAGLLATADMNGEVRLWRLPRDTTLPVTSPQLLSAHLYFDGEHVVDTAYDKLRVATVSGKTATPWIVLPQPIAYAQLADNSRSLIAVSGNDMYVFDAATMKTRHAPIKLLSTPQHFALSQDGATAVLTFAHNDKSGFHEWLRVFDLHNGGQQIGEASVSSPLRDLEISPGKRRVLAIGSANGSVDVFDLPTLSTSTTYPNNPSRPVLWASFTRDCNELWMVTRDIDDGRGNDAEILRWDLTSQKIVEKRSVPGLWPVGITTIGGTPLLATKDRLLLDPGAGNEHTSPRQHGGEATTVFALSHDGRLVANSYGRYIQIYDATNLEPVGPPLTTNMRSLDSADSLAFSPDDHSLLGLAAGSRQFIVWPVAADDRDIADLNRDKAMLAPAPRGLRILQIADDEQRAALRARDPGRRRQEDRPQTAAVKMIDDMPVPARSTDVSPLQLDLGDYYNIAPDSIRSIVDTNLPVAGGMPFGKVTLDDVQYDIRGGLELRYASRVKSSVGLQSKVPGIPVPPVAVAALHVLVDALGPSPVSSEIDYAYVRLHYRDGTDALLPLRTQREVPGWTNHDRPVPIGWVMSDVLPRQGIHQQTVISNPRLPNPHPERIITSIDLEAGDRQWNEPIFFAITVEPVIPVANSEMNAVGKDSTRAAAKGSQPQRHVESVN
jgi:WD40 repeat protein